MPYATAFSTGCLALLPIARIAEVATLNLRATSQSPSTPSTVPVPTRLFMSQAQRTPVQTDIYEEEKHGVINHSALSKATSSARMHY